MKGAKVSNRGLVIFHLVFANDTIIFDEAINRVVMLLKDILNENEHCTRQFINYKKSTIFFIVLILL